MMIMIMIMMFRCVNSYGWDIIRYMNLIRNLDLKTHPNAYLAT